jgi:hypothetical protein
VTDGGYHGRFIGGTLTPDGESLVGWAIPWLPEDLHEGGFSSHLPPNFGLYPRFDCVSYSTIWPIEVDRCVDWTYFLFPAEYFDRPGFMEAAQGYADFFQEVLDEDLEMIHALQKGLKSDYYGRGPMSPLKGEWRVSSSTISRTADRTRWQGPADSPSPVQRPSVRPCENPSVITGWTSHGHHGTRRIGELVGGVESLIYVDAQIRQNTRGRHGGHLQDSRKVTLHLRIRAFHGLQTAPGRSAGSIGAKRRREFIAIETQLAD